MKTAFMFDDVCVPPDRQIGRHAHPQWELSLVICGAGTRTIGNLTEPMTEGEIIFIPPNIPHVWNFTPSHTDSDGNIANITVFFETETLDHLSNLFPEMAVVIDKLKTLSEAIRLNGETYDKVYGLLMEMRDTPPAARVSKMIEIIRLLATADSATTAGRNNSLTRSERRLENVRAYCNCNYTRQVSLQDVAAYVGMNKSAFCIFMRHYAGKSFSDFINDIRLERAMEMLRHTDHNIADIAYDTGFTNVTYFNRRFRSKYNCTPKSVRTQRLLW